MKLSFTVALLLAYYLQSATIVSGASVLDCKKQVPYYFACQYCGPGSPDIGTVHCDNDLDFCDKDCSCNTYYYGDFEARCFDLSGAAAGNDGLSGGAIAAIVMVLLFLLAVGGVAIWYFAFYRPNLRTQQQQVTPVRAKQAQQLATAATPTPVQMAPPTEDQQLQSNQTKTIVEEVIYNPDGSKTVTITEEIVEIEPIQDDREEGYCSF